jgi:hypothetical protein
MPGKSQILGMTSQRMLEHVDLPQQWLMASEKTFCLPHRNISPTVLRFPGQGRDFKWFAVCLHSRS